MKVGSTPWRKGKRVIILGGDNITLDGLNFDFVGPDGKELGVKAIKAVIYGDGIGHLRVTRLRAIKKTYEWKGKGPREPAQHGPTTMEGWTHIIALKDCHDIEVDRCKIANVGYLVRSSFCRNLSVHENRAQWSAGITRFERGWGLRHYSNWSSKVVFQGMWWGGNPGIRDKRTNVVRPDIKAGDKGFDMNTAGVYDISIQNNYAEYGAGGFWGAKARNVLISGNTVRFMSDMAYDVEGDENVIFANNIAINGRLGGGIGCYFWTGNVLITGNVILVLDEGDDWYKGPMFVRLHSGGMPPNRSGIGKALITGNLFVSEVRNKMGQGGTLNRMIQIEDCRDVTISGNKFINGWIRTLPWAKSSKVTIINNEFDNRIAGNGPVIRIDSKGTEAIIRNNIIRKTAAENNPAFKDSAIHILAASKKRIIIDGNIIEGWKKSISCKPKNPNATPARYIIKDNMLSGTINLLGIKALFKKYVKDNLNLKSFRAVKEKQIPEKDLKNEKYKM